MSAALVNVDLNALTLEVKLKHIQAVKAETEALRQHIIYTKSRMTDVTLTQVAVNTPPLGNLRVKSKNVFKGHVGKIYSMKIDKSDQFLVSAAQDGFVLIWDAYTTGKLDAFQLANPWVLTCDLSPSGSRIASGGLDNAITIYPRLDERNDNEDQTHQQQQRHGKVSKHKSEVKPRTPLCILKGHNGFISYVEFIDDQKLICNAGDMSFVAWDIVSSRKLREYRDHLGDVTAVKLNPRNPNMVVSASSDSMVKIWDLREKRSSQTFAMASQAEINVIDFFPEGLTFGVGADDGLCTVFDLRSDCQVSSYKLPDLHSLPMTSLHFSPSGRMVFAGFQDGLCGSWDLLKENWITTITGHNATVTSLQTTSDGHRLFSASWDSSLRSWEIAL